MINNLDEAIAHAREKAEEQKKKAERNIIETTKEGWIRVYDGKEYNVCLECAREHEQLAEWLTELQERREADRWIPVSERLPEEQRSVLICYRTQGGIAQAVSERFIRNDGTEGWSAMLGRKPFAWKELGEPYNPWKKKKENDK